MTARKITRCRLCGSGTLYTILDLGSQALAGQFPGPNDPDPPSCPLELVRCGGDCGLVQLRHTVPPEEQFTNYWYRSGVSSTMVAHLKAMADEAWDLVPNDLHVGRRVLDIGCNDGELLSHTKAGWGSRYGIDPAGVCHRGDGIIYHRGFFPQDVPAQWPAFDLVFSVACFYDADDPVGFARAVHGRLTEDGLWCVEVASLVDMLGNLSYDSIVHEHLCYYDVASLARVLVEAGFCLDGLPRINSCNGGSLRVYARRGQGYPYPRGDYDLAGFAARVRRHRTELLRYLEQCRSGGLRVHLLGASTKANTVLQFCGIDRGLVEVACDRDPRKHGRRTPGSNIPILYEEEARKDRPHVYLSTLSHFKDEVVQRERDSGFHGDIVFALPELEVIRL